MQHEQDDKIKSLESLIVTSAKESNTSAIELMQAQEKRAIAREKESTIAIISQIKIMFQQHTGSPEPSKTPPKLPLNTKLKENQPSNSSVSAVENVSCHGVDL